MAAAVIEVASLGLAQKAWDLLGQKLVVLPKTGKIQPELDQEDREGESDHLQFLNWVYRAVVEKRGRWSARDIVWVYARRLSPTLAKMYFSETVLNGEPGKALAKDPDHLIELLKKGDWKVWGNLLIIAYSVKSWLYVEFKRVSPLQYHRPFTYRGRISFLEIRVKNHLAIMGQSDLISSLPEKRPEIGNYWLFEPRDPVTNRVMSGAFVLVLEPPGLTRG